MPNNNLKDILLGVESTLTASPSLVNSTCLKEVAIGRTVDHASGFVFCRVYAGQFKAPVADTVSYEFGYGVNVELWQELTNKSKRDAELDLANALHQVLSRLAASWQLGIGVEVAEIADGEVREVETNAGPMLLAPIRLNVTTLIQNPS